MKTIAERRIIVGFPAEDLLKDLKSAREGGRVTYEKPISASRLCDIYNERNGWSLTSVDIRQMINYLRNEEDEPVGTNDKGCYYALTSEELSHSVHHLESRLREQAETLRNLKRLVSNMQKRESGLFEHPTMKALRKEFSIQPA